MAINRSAVEALTNINADAWLMRPEEDEPTGYRELLHGSRTEDLHAAALRLAADLHPRNPEVVRLHDDSALARQAAQAMRVCDEQLRELRAAMPAGIFGATLQRGERERLLTEIGRVEGRRGHWEQEARRTDTAAGALEPLGVERDAVAMIASELRERNMHFPGDDEYGDEAIHGEPYSYNSHSAPEPEHGCAEVRRLVQAGFPAAPGARAAAAAGSSDTPRRPTAAHEPSASAGPER